MWSPAVTTIAPATEPVTLAQAKEYLAIDGTAHDTKLESFIAVAREQVEGVTGTRLVEQTVELRASCFADLASLPIGPVTAVTSLVYDDTTGAEQTVDPADYELFGAGLATGIRPVVGATWPTPRAAVGSVRLTATVGYETLPMPVWAAMLRIIGDLFTFRETVTIGAASSKIPMSATVENMLANHRIWL